VKTAPLAVKDPRGRPILVGPAWPVMIQDGAGRPVDGAVFMVSHANREEKGSDVNVAAHRLLDVTRAVCHDRAALPTLCDHRAARSPWSRTRRAPG